MDINETQLKESISALVDGEASALELRRVLKEVPDNKSLRDSWRHHQMSSAAIHQTFSSQVIDFSAEIGAAIKLEKTYGTSPLSDYFIKPLGRFAIAASVTAVALVGLQQFTQSTDSLQPYAAKSDTQLSFPNWDIRTSAEFGIPQISTQAVNLSDLPLSAQKFTRKSTLQNRSKPADPTREQVQTYLDSLLEDYQQIEAALAGH
ncbi:MAG: sigma-E factor negative regulatory protein RseA [Saprospiraceae bacterium]|jgi:sigma-E factor negative regulatory protein RseA